MRNLFRILGYISLPFKVIFAWGIFGALALGNYSDRHFSDGSMESNGAGFLELILVMSNVFWLLFLSCLPFILF